MKKMKRLVAVLLAGVMALTMLTACGGSGGSGDNDPPPYEKNENVLANAISILNNNSFDQTADLESLSKIAEKYAQKIALSPTSYNDLNKPAFQALQSDWIKESKTVFSANYSWSYWTISPYYGTNSEADAISYYGTAVNNAINHFNKSISDRHLSGDSYYFIYPMYITNPSDPTESVWSLFMILYLLPN